MRPLVAGNWKMNGLAASLGELAALKDALANQPSSCDVLVCPPATLIAQAAWHVKGAFALGGQDCHAEACGAYTGDISAEMLKDAGASYVIVGHSERRQYHGETDSDVAAKARAAWRAGLKAIICAGETEAQRDAAAAREYDDRRYIERPATTASGERVRVMLNLAELGHVAAVAVRDCDGIGLVRTELMLRPLSDLADAARQFEHYLDIVAWA